MQHAGLRTEADAARVSRRFEAAVRLDGRRLENLSAALHRLARTWVTTSRRDFLQQWSRIEDFDHNGESEGYASPGGYLWFGAIFLFMSVGAGLGLAKSQPGGVTKGDIALAAALYAGTVICLWGAWCRMPGGLWLLLVPPFTIFAPLILVYYLAFRLGLGRVYYLVIGLGQMPRYQRQWLRARYLAHGLDTEQLDALVERVDRHLDQLRADPGDRAEP